MSETIPDLSLFMMCDTLQEEALCALPPEYFFRRCRKSELERWKSFPFDTCEEAKTYQPFMTDYFRNVYAPEGDLFYEKCLFVCDAEDRPIATGFAWKAYGRITTLHWFKVLKPFEGRGIGRALMSQVMRELAKDEYPVFLHTHPSSFRAIKLYSDFGFRLLTDPIIGTRQNGLADSLPLLRKYMPAEAYEALKTAKAPDFFLEATESSPIEAF